MHIIGKNDEAGKANVEGSDKAPGDQAGARGSEVAERTQQNRLPNGWPAGWFLPDPDAGSTSPEAVYEAAQSYVASGLSVIPIAADGSKAPDSRRLPRHWDDLANRYRPSWQVYQVRRPKESELTAWRDHGGPFGLAVLGGVVSGGRAGCGLEVIDFDTEALFEPWSEAVNGKKPGLVERLVRVRSPRPGVHAYYHCPSFGGSAKLACVPELEPCGGGQAGASRSRKTLIELKGEGGYCIVPPSPRACHPNHGLYSLAEGSGDLTKVPTVTPEERGVLLDAARAFNRWAERPRPSGPPRPVNKGAQGGRPGDDFNARAEWSDILSPHGWALDGRRGDVEDWRRPGKGSGISATVNYAGSGLLYVFSSNAAPLEDNTAYSKFSAYALLEHAGDFAEAARALAALGYGQRPSEARLLVIPKDQ